MSNMIVKIGDFGLALNRWDKTETNSIKFPLPIGWMALESLLHGDFNAQSDV